MEALDSMIRELGLEKARDYPKTLTAEEIITSILGTRQMRLADYC